MSLLSTLEVSSVLDCNKTYLQSVFPAKSLLAVFAGEWLDSHVDSFVSLQVVVAVEASRALVTFARFVIWVSASWPRVYAVHLVSLHTRVRVTLHGYLSHHHRCTQIVKVVLHELSRESWKVITVVRTIPVCGTRWRLHCIWMISCNGRDSASRTTTCYRRLLGR